MATDPERIGPDPDITVFSRIRIGSTCYNKTGFGSDPDLIIRISIFKNILAIPIFQTRSVYFSENFGVVTDFSDQRASVTD